MKYVLLMSIIISLFVILPRVFLSVYVYRDSVNRELEEPVLWVILTIFIPYYIGFLIYIVLRNKKYVKCKDCGFKIPKDSKYCNKCGSENKEDTSEEVEIYKNNKKFLILALIFILLEIIVPVVFITSNIFVSNTEINQASKTHSIESIASEREFKFRNNSEKYSFYIDDNVNCIRVEPHIRNGKAYIYAYSNGNKKAEFEINRDTDDFDIHPKDYMNKDSKNESDIYFILKTEEATGKIEIDANDD